MLQYPMAMADDYKFCNNKKHHITSPQIHGAAVLNKVKLTGSNASSVMASGSASVSNTSFMWSHSNNVSKSVADGIFAAASSAARNGCRVLKKWNISTILLVLCKKTYPKFFLDELRP